MIAQQVEHLYVKQETRGSIPGFGQHFSAIKPLSYPYGLLSGFLMCLLDKIYGSIYCIIHADISWTASLAWMHPVIVPQLLSFFYIFLFRYAAMCDCILVYTIAMPVCTCCLSVAHTCFSLSVIVVFLFAPDSLGLCTYCTIFFVVVVAVMSKRFLILIQPFVFFLSCIFLFFYLFIVNKFEFRYITFLPLKIKEIQFMGFKWHVCENLILGTLISVMT